MTTREGDKVRSIFTNKLYRVKMINDRMVILESEDRSSQVLTEKENLKLFYERVENENNVKDLIVNLLPPPSFTNMD
jgi:hypothetical protein